jgi:hypothetical protein
MVGSKGVNGTNGVGYTPLTSNSPITPSVTTLNLVTAQTSAASAFVVNNRIRVYNTSNASNYFEGVISSYAGTGLGIAVDTLSPATATASAWTVIMVGQRGAEGPQGLIGPQGPAGLSSLTATSTSTLPNGYVYINDGLVTSATTSPAASLTPASKTIVANGETYSLSIATAGGVGSWTITAVPAWATISPLSGSGNASVTVTVTSNPNAFPRSQAIIISGQIHTITQNGQLVVSDTLGWSPNYEAQILAPSTSVTQASGVTWTATSNQSWVTLTSGTNTGTSITVTGNGSPQTLNVQVVNNPNSTQRSATITIGSQTISVVQGGRPVLVTLNGAKSVAKSIAPAAFTEVVALVATPAGAWSVSGIPTWLTVSASSGSANASLTFSATANVSAPRTANVVVNDALYDLTQYIAPTISPSSKDVNRQGNSFSVNVTASAGQAWTATAPSTYLGYNSQGQVAAVASFATISHNGSVAGFSVSGVGPGIVTVITQANPITAYRSVIMSIAGRSFEVTQGFQN